MPQPASRSSAKGESATPPVRRRLTAEARKSSILKAARRAFTETGDMNGTTIRAIAERGPGCFGEPVASSMTTSVQTCDVSDTLDELMAAFDRAGFDSQDVHMSDLQAGRVRLAAFSGRMSTSTRCRPTRWRPRTRAGRAR